MILHLAISVEHRLVTDRQTHDYGIYRASMASYDKNGSHVTDHAHLRVWYRLKANTWYSPPVYKIWRL